MAAMLLIDEQTGGALWICFFILWVAVGLVNYLYFRGSTDGGRKRRIHRWMVAAYGTTYFLLIALSIGPSPVLLFFGAFIALIIYLNIRNTTFCDACGRTVYNHMWLGKADYCAKCGAKLVDK